MNEDDVFKQTGETYLRLIHPVRPDEDFREVLAPLVQLSSAAPEALVAAMIVGASWRERLLGISLALAKCPGRLTGSMIQSLRDLRGISIVPVCAAFAVLARRGLFDIAQLQGGAFDRAAFDGEVGWAVDQAVAFARGEAVLANRRGPNYGQVFEDQIQVFEWIMDGQQDGPANGRHP
jgi:hypothetical protein